MKNWKGLNSIKSLSIKEKVFYQVFIFRSLNIRLKCIDICFLNFSFCNSVFLMCLCSSLAGSRWRVRMDIISRNLVCTKGRKEFVNTNSYQDSLTVASYSTRQHERCNSDASGETSAVQVGLLLLLSYFSLFCYYFIIFDK